MIGARDIALAVAGLIAQAKVDLTHEAGTQRDLEDFLRARLPEGAEISREHRLGPGDRPDFLLFGCIAVEAKIKRTATRARAVLAQLDRYARHEGVRGLVLVSGRSLDLPRVVRGKPLVLVDLARGWL